MTSHCRYKMQGHVEHFDSVWSKEVHSLMKRMNIEIPQKCDSVMYYDIDLPKSIVWFLNVNWGITNCLQYCGEVLEDSEDEEMNSHFTMDKFAQIFFFDGVAFTQVYEKMDEKQR